MPIPQWPGTPVVVVVVRLAQTLERHGDGVPPAQALARTGRAGLPSGGTPSARQGRGRPRRAPRGRVDRCAVVAATRALVAGLALAAVLAQLVDLAAHGALRPATFFSYFTIQSALLGSGMLLVGAARWRTVHSSAFDLLRGGAVLYLLVTGIVFAVLLARTAADTTLPWANVVLHQALPIALLLDWLLVPPVQRLAPRHGLLWLSYPLAWAASTLVRGVLVGWYPYPFLDPATAGVGAVAGSSIALLSGMLLLAEVVVLIGNAARPRRLTLHGGALAEPPLVGGARRLELPRGTLRLDPSGQAWHLEYALCGHSQQFPRDAWLASPARAEREARFYYGTCLTCQLDRQLGKRSREPSSRIEGITAAR